MKKLWFIPLLTLSVILTACSNNSNETASETENNASEEQESSETEDLEEENGESERKELEEENENLKKDLEESEKDEEQSTVVEETEEDSADNEISTGESQTDNSDLHFDIHSEEVQAQLLGTSSGNEDGTFIQDKITEGMSQTEVEEKYGPYEFTFYGGGASPAFHGNLGVVYSERSPYGTGNDTSDSSINPDENYVEYVWYFANTTEEGLINALGEPDEYFESSESMNGLPYYVYEGEGEDGRYYITGASTYNSPDGERIGIIKREVFDENPKASNETMNEEDIPTTEAPDPNAEIKYAADYENRLTEYLQRLATHYNSDNYDDIYDYLKRGSAAYDKIAANKASGDFTGHTTHSVELVSIKDLGDGTVELNADRVYSHDNSDGQQEANVTYIVNAETHEILDFE